MHLFRDSAAAGFVALALASCGGDPAPADTTPAAADVAPVASTCADLGSLRGSLSGAITADVDWGDAALRCESMLRPDDRGVRLRFSGEIGGERLAIIIAMPTLEAGATGAEYDSVVTITVEGSGRFFSTPSLGSCWTDVQTNSPLDDGGGLYNVAGGLSCVVPLGEFNGDAFVDVRELQFSGVADWSKS